MENLKFLFLTALVALLAFSCEKDETPDPDPEPDPVVIVSPSDIDALNAILTFPTGATSVNGTPPSPSTEAGAPVVVNQIPTVTSSNGSTAILNFSYSNINGSLEGCYVQVDGAGNYYVVPYTDPPADNGDLIVPIGIPTNVGEGEFCVSFCVYDDQGRVSNVVETCVTVLRLGTGAIQVSLVWNTPTDQDLYVVDPAGNEIYFQNTTSPTGGQLDRDDLDGFGPENIFWLENAPDGEYQVKVDDYNFSTTENLFFVTVSGPNQSQSYEGTTIESETVDVVTFEKRGDNLIF